MSETIEPFSPEGKTRQPAVRFALTDVVVIGAAVAMTAVLCWLAYLFPQSYVEPTTGSASLAEVPTSALLKLPRTAQTCHELLRRPDVDHETLRAALVRLGRLQQQTSAELLMELATGVDASTEKSRLKNLCQLAEVVPQRDDLRRRMEVLARTEDDFYRRQVGTAMLVSIDGNADALFAATNGNAEQLTELLQALPLVHNVEIQSRTYDNIRRLLLDDNETRLDLKKTAITVMVDLRGREEIKAVDLIRLVETKGLQNAAIDGFSKLPMEAWPQEELGQFAARITSWVAYHSPDDRRTPELQTAISLTDRISELFTGEKRRRLVDRLAKLRPQTD